jgi:hypothetical protein
LLWFVLNLVVIFRKAMNKLGEIVILISMLILFNSCKAQNKELKLENQISVTSETEKVKKTSSINKSEILSGIGISEVQLGDSKERVLASLGQPFGEYNYKYEKKYSGANCFERQEIFWIEPDKDNDGKLDFDGQGITVYLKENKVSQIYISTPRYETINEIVFGDTEKQLLKKYAEFGKLQKFVLVKSAEKYNGGQDLYYYVDSNNGIAFELSFNKGINQRSVWAILIFSPNTEFIPEECLMETQRLEPLTTEDVRN